MVSTDSDNSLLVFDIQRFCVHDGPGLRSVVFLKGCPLSCRWCQNPESLKAAPQMAFYADRCAGCLQCADACPNDAILPEGPRIDRDKCLACGQCAQACPHEALRKIGWTTTPDQLLEQLEADRPYFEATGGGVTLSGGEPLAQPGAIDLLAQCRKAGLSTLVETCGAVPWARVEAAWPHVDRFFFDLKGAGDSLHRWLTGCSLDAVTSTAERLVQSGADVAFRMPIVPGLNDSKESLDGVAELLSGFGADSLELLPYHAGGNAKIDRIAGGQPKLTLSGSDADAAVIRAADRFSQRGISAACPARATPVKRDTKPLFSERVWRLRSAVQSAAPSICTERALLVTAYFRKARNRAKPMMLQKAEALRHVLRSKRAMIYRGELLVGAFSSKRVGGSLFPELHGTAMMEDLLTFRRRKVNPLRIDPKDTLALGTRVMPFWLNKFLAFKAFDPPKAMRFIADQLGAKRYVINETGGISHFVPDFEKLLRLGTSGIAAKARRYERSMVDARRKNFYRAVQLACLGLEEMAEAYVAEARRLAGIVKDAARRQELEEIARTCERAPKHGAATLREAFQTLLFAQIALNLESLDNSVSPGRLDQVLAPYYLEDRKAGRITQDEARELVGCYTVKMSEIVPVFSRRITRIHGGMFNGQVVAVGGVDRQGQDATNDLTYMFLDAMDALRMRQPNYHARIHAGSPAPYVARVAQMLADGSGAPSLMNDDVVVPMLRGRGFRIEDARNYSPVGCVEPVACGATFGSTDAALFNVARCLENALGSRPDAKGDDASGCANLDEVMVRFSRELDMLVDQLIRDLQAIERANAAYHPTPLTSMLLEGCLESGVDSTAGGARYNASGIQPVGLVDVADSLAAVKRVVFRDERCDMATLIQALRADFAGFETIRGYLLRAPKFGNDDAGADLYVDRVLQMFTRSLRRYTNTRGGPYLAGLYSVTSHKAFGESIGALPSGRRAAQALANGLSPANGHDRLGPTACLNSAASPDLIGHAQNGVNVNLKVDAPSLWGPAGAGALEGLIRGYFAKGGMQVQMNVLDPAVLAEARDDPNKHPWLLVRVSGYSAYFNDLSPGMKQEIIDRTLHGTN